MRFDLDEFFFEFDVFEFRFLKLNLLVLFNGEIGELFFWKLLLFMLIFLFLLLFFKDCLY